MSTHLKSHVFKKAYTKQFSGQVPGMKPLIDGIEEEADDDDHILNHSQNSQSNFHKKRTTRSVASSTAKPKGLFNDFVVQPVQKTISQIKKNPAALHQQRDRQRIVENSRATGGQQNSVVDILQKLSAAERSSNVGKHKILCEAYELALQLAKDDKGWGHVVDCQLWDEADKKLRPQIEHAGHDRLRAVLRAVYGFSNKSEHKEVSKKFNALKNQFAAKTPSAEIGKLLARGGVDELCEELSSSPKSDRKPPAPKLTQESIEQIAKISLANSGCEVVFKLLIEDKKGKIQRSLKFLGLANSAEAHEADHAVKKRSSAFSPNRR